METTPPPSTVFLVDDDPSVLRAVGRLVRSAGWTVSAFSSPQQFLAAQNAAAPGCLILDVGMPGLNGLELQRALREASNPLPIIFLSGTSDIPMSVQAMKLGAADFLSKPCRDEVLLGAIGAALARDREFRREQRERAALAGLFATLTPREGEVMLGVISGKLNKQIAADLGIVEKTIKVHRAHVMAKLCVSSVAELVRLAGRAGVSMKVT